MYVLCEIMMKPVTLMCQQSDIDNYDERKYEEQIFYKKFQDL